MKYAQLKTVLFEVTSNPSTKNNPTNKETQNFIVPDIPYPGALCGSLY